MRERFEYAVAWAVLKFLGLLPRTAARWLAARLAALLFRVQPAWRRVALFNLQLAFPDWTEPQRENVVRTMVRNLGWLAAEFAHLPHTPARTLNGLSCSTVSRTSPPPNSAARVCSF